MKKTISKLFYKYLSPHFRGGVALGNKKRVRIGSHTYINNPKNLHISDDVFIGNFNNIDSSIFISIGKGTQITNFVSILNHSSHKAVSLLKDKYFDEVLQLPLLNREKVVIGEYCFIGPYSCIMPGTIVGNGCIIQAYSYVKGTFPNGVIIGGNPAKIIGNVEK